MDRVSSPYGDLSKKKIYSSLLSEIDDLVFTL